MKTRFLALLLALVMVASVLVLSACEFNSGDDSANDGCEDGGTRHTWNSEYSGDSLHHWHDCKNCDAKSDVQKHTSANGDICDICGLENPDINHLVIFNTNGGSEISTRVIDNLETVKTPPAPSKAGFAFDAWYSDEGLINKFDFNTPITADTTLYAKWLSIFALHFDTNGGNNIADWSLIEGHAIKNPPTPKRSGYIFDGWYADELLSTPFDFSKGLTADTTLYAKWEKQHTLIFDSCGGSPCDSQVLGANGIAVAPKDPTRDEYRFDGWYKDADLTEKFDFSEIITSDTTLYAKWVVVHTVSFNSNGGSSRSAITVDTSSTAEKPRTPTRYGFDFIGWYEDENLTKEFDFSNPITKDITLYAKWTPEASEIPSDSEYTYSTYTLAPIDTLSSHSYKSTSIPEFVSYTAPGFYSYDYNETKNGYKVVPEIAASMPIDVTADYVGEAWQIGEGETARVWRIPLRSDIKWEDGTPITAHDFVTSFELLLNPKTTNVGVISYIDGDLIISNAERYYMSGKTIVEDNNITEAYSISDLIMGSDGFYTTPEGGEIWIALKSPLDWLSGRSLNDYVEAYGSSYFNVESYNQLLSKANKDGDVKISEETLRLFIDVITDKTDWEETPEYAKRYLKYYYTYPDFDFENVGIKAISDTELVLILEEPLEGFYLHSELMISWLVHEELYKSCTSYDEKTGAYINTYGTSTDTYMSYGPYKLTTFEKDKKIILTKNDEWYGHGENIYQTTRIVYSLIENSEVALQAFLQGRLDYARLDPYQIEDYGYSDNLYYSDGPSTFFIAMNPNEEAFSKWEAKYEGKDKSIMTIKEFRMALSFALDRQAFSLACDPTGSSAYALFNSVIISDPENGTHYRQTEQAKDVMLKYWCISEDDIGPGKKYANKDEAIASIKGYDLEYAKELFDIAYDKVISAGLMDESDVVEICIGLPSMFGKFYVNGYNFLVDSYTEAVKGTKLEGKLTFTKDDTITSSFSDPLKTNAVDLLFGVGWAGKALDPYSFMMAYTSPYYQYNLSSWNTKYVTMDMVIPSLGDKTYRTTIEQWTYAMMGNKTAIIEIGADGNPVSNSSVAYSCGPDDGLPEERLNLLAALEDAVLSTYDLIPLNNASSVSLKSQKVNYGTEHYIYGIGRGGIKYMTYNYNDAAWAEFIQMQNSNYGYK